MQRMQRASKQNTSSGGGAITNGFQITEANTGYNAYLDPGLGRLVVAGDLIVHTGLVSLSDFTTNGGTLTRHWFQGGLNFDLNNVILTACKFDGSVSGYYAGTHHTFTLNWCSIGDDNTSAYDDGIHYQDYTAYRCRIGGSSDGAKINGNVTMTECYVRTMSQGSADHNDGLQAVGSYTGGTIQRCNIDCRPVNGGGGVNGAIFIADSSNGTWIIRDNFLAGGNSPLRMHESCNYTVDGNWILSGSYSGGPVNAQYAVSVTWASTENNVLVDASGNILSVIPSP